MKKIFCLFLALFLLSGCGKTTEKNISNEFIKKVNKTNTYYLKGTMEIINNDDTFKYNIDVRYDNGKKIRVNLVNKINEHEQVILKNSDGVYVVTPSLNKSFKFQSEWPDNSSQSYLLHNLKNDIKNDQKVESKKKDNLFYIKATVDYPNNPSLKYEKIVVDKKGNLKEVQVYDKNDNLKIKLKVNKLDLNASTDDDYFELSSIVDENCCKTTDQNPSSSKDKDDENCCNASNSETDNNCCNNNETDKTTSATDDITYPLYLPTETYLTSKDVINTDEGSRTILTFTGSKPFILVEETAAINSEFEVIPVYGDPEILNDAVASLSSSSLTWTSNNKDYYLTSSNLSNEEMLSVAASINNSTAVLAEK